MSASVEELLAEARKLPAEAQRRLVSALLAEAEGGGEEGLEVRAALAIVQETRGTIKGLNRRTLIMLAEDEEFSGH